MKKVNLLIQEKTKERKKKTEKEKNPTTRAIIKFGPIMGLGLYWAGSGFDISYLPLLDSGSRVHALVRFGKGSDSSPRPSPNLADGRMA